jgi:hypothetical protein
MKFKEHYNSTKTSRAIKYHIDNGLDLSDSIFRIDSEAYRELICEARQLLCEDKIEVNEDDVVILEKLQTGVKAKYKGKTVTLDTPRRAPKDSKKKYRVYHNSGRKDKDGNIIAKKIEFGSRGMKVKNYDDKARKSFLARHKCDSKSDQSTPGWWSCNVHRFHKMLGLKSSKRW